MSLIEQVTHDINDLSQPELEKVAEYLAFLKFHAQLQSAPRFDETQLAALYAEFAREDRLLAEEGLADYVEGLTTEGHT